MNQRDIDNLTYTARLVTVTVPVGQMMAAAQIAAERGEDPAVRRALAAQCHTMTAGAVTDLIAVYLAIAIIERLGIRPSATRAHGFTLIANGRPLTPATAPPRQLARARMVTAVANADALAARDVFLAFADAYPDQVPDLLVEMSDGAAGVDDRDRACGCGRCPR